MNSVDRFDQVRQTNATERREKDLSKSILTFLINAAMNNAYAVYRKKNETLSKVDSFKEFKRKIAEQFVTKNDSNVIVTDI